MGRCLLIIAVILNIDCARSTSLYLYDSPDLKIEKIGAHTYQHVSYLNYNGNSIGCNGVFSVFGGDAVIIDSPTDTVASNELLDFIDNNFEVSRIRAIPNHFHVDCTGGLKTMIDRGVFVYAYAETVRLMEDQNMAKEMIPFHQNLDLKLGNGDGVILNRFSGAAHTLDNIATYILPDSILFGGCMVKTIGASKGNLSDADTLMWSETVRHVKNSMFGNAKLVVPGHGKNGGIELLDYTIQMFEKQK